MRLTTLAIALSLALPMGIAQADVVSDIQKGLSIQAVMMNAKAAKVSAVDALTAAIDTVPLRVEEVIAAAVQQYPEQAAEITAAAIKQGVPPTKAVAAALQGAKNPDVQKAIVAAAMKESPLNANLIAQVAVDNGVSADDIKSAANSAGVKVVVPSPSNSNTGGVVGNSGITLPPASNPSAGGGGGGGSVSGH